MSRVTPFMNLSKKKMLMNSFFKSQFSYCPLVWMCHSRTINNKINHLHERCLRVIYNDKISSFKGATILYFTNYARVVITLFNTGLYKSPSFTDSFGKGAFFLSALCRIEIDVTFINFITFTLHNYCL